MLAQNAAADTQAEHADTAMFWLPTFEPFKREFTRDCDWIHFEPLPVEPSELEFPTLDRDNPALQRMVPSANVRSSIIESIEIDIVCAAAIGCDVSMDRLHGEVITARFEKDALVSMPGMALPILVPKVGQLAWDDVGRIRSHRALSYPRAVLREVEAEAFGLAVDNIAIDDAIRVVYSKKMRSAAEEVDSIVATGRHAFIDLVVGSAAGYATVGLSSTVAPVAGAAIAASFTTGLQVRRFVRRRRERAWVAVMDSIAAAVF
jgi:hypothetical protein